MNSLQDKAIGALMAAAVGDAIGGATEGRSTEEILERYDGYVEGVTDYFMKDWRTAKPMSPYYKGEGHVTDDTLMTNLLVAVYEKQRRHLTAFDMADDLVPLMMNHMTWIPELEKETVPLLRVFLAEKWLVTRLYYGHVDPREAGVGNIVNCGAAMYMAPVGIANAGDPAGAYAEAVEIGGAHQSSYGREAGAVFAAAIAAAMAPGATVDSVLAAAIDLAKDGTRQRSRRCSPRPCPGRTGARAFRCCATPSGRSTRSARPTASPAQDSRRPSRLRAIEELPVALGFLKVTGGDVRGSILGATNYGRDSDSIATMGGAIAGRPRRRGRGARPTGPRRSSTGSRLDLRAGGLAMAAVAEEIFTADEAAFRSRGQPDGCARVRVDPAGGAGTDASHLGATRGPRAATSSGSPSAEGRDVAGASASGGRRPDGARAALRRSLTRRSRPPSSAPSPSELLLELDALPDVDGRPEPSDWSAIAATIAPAVASSRRRRRHTGATSVTGCTAAWLGRAVGCVLGKPVEKVPRAGIEAILRVDRSVAARPLLHRGRARPDGVGAVAVEQGQPPDQPRGEHRRHARGRRHQLHADGAAGARAARRRLHLGRRRPGRGCSTCRPGAPSPPSGSPTATCSRALAAADRPGAQPVP